MDCLTNIIGVTQNNCPCLQNGLNAEQIEELSMSKSGIFLEELEGGLFLRDVVQLDKCLTFINIQKNAINTAINDPTRVPTVRTIAFLVESLEVGLSRSTKVRSNHDMSGTRSYSSTNQVANPSNIPSTMA